MVLQPDNVATKGMYVLSEVIAEYEQRPDSAIDYMFPVKLHFLARDVEHDTKIPAQPQGKFCSNVFEPTRKLHEVLCGSNLQFNFSSEGLYVRHGRLKPEYVHAIVEKALLAIPGVKRVVLREKSSASLRLVR